MPTLDEQFEEWLKKETAANGHIYVTNGDAFLAGAAAERKAVLIIVEDVKTDHWPRESGRGDGYDLDTCDEITRRIRQRGEEGK